PSQTRVALAVVLTGTTRADTAPGRPVRRCGRRPPDTAVLDARAVPLRRTAVAGRGAGPGSGRFDMRVRRTRRQAVGDDRAATLSRVWWAKLRPLKSRDPALHS